MGGGCVAKERKEIESVTESRTDRIRNNFNFFDKQKCLKTLNCPNVFKF